MKLYTVLLLFCFSILTYAQSDFYPGQLVKPNGDNETVFFKLRAYALKKDGTVKVYKARNLASEVVLRATDFSEITSDDSGIRIISAQVSEINNQSIILRQLVNGKVSLYEYIGTGNEKLYVSESDGAFELLRPKKTEDSSTLGFKQWLFKNFNPSGKPMIDYSKLSYNSGSLIDYYVSNNPDNTAIELEQEQKVDFINLGAHAGYNHNALSITGGDVTYNDFNGSNLRIGIRGSFNFDRVKNNFALFAGLDYYTSIEEGGDAIVFPSSSFNSREANSFLEYGYWSAQVGGQYNFHFKSFTLSPYVSVETLRLSSDKRVAVIFEDGSTFYDERNNFVADVFSLNAGLKLTALQNFYILLEYGSSADIQAITPRGTSFLTVNAKQNRLSFTVGYNIF